MKTYYRLMAVGVVFHIGLAVGQITNNPNAFDNAASTASWTTYWSSAGVTNLTASWDGLADALGRPNSGSLKISVFLSEATNNFAVFGTFGNQAPWDGSIALDASAYDTLNFDLRVDSADPPWTNGAPGYLQAGLVASSLQLIPVGTIGLPAPGTNWTHYRLPINRTLPGLSNVIGTEFGLWSIALSNQLTLHLDNVTVARDWCECPLPPPRLMLSRATSGLNLVATGTNEAQCQSIFTVQPAYSWVGASTSVTYTVNIRELPAATERSPFQTHLWLVPAADMPSGPTDSNIAWNATNVLFLQVLSDANAHAVGRFMYKTGQGSGDSMFWNADSLNGPVGTLATLEAFCGAGEWKLTFRDTTNVFLECPFWGATNFVMPASAAAKFSGPVHVYLGVRPLDRFNFTKAAILGGVRITGCAAGLEETFSGGTLNANVWGGAAEDPQGIVVVPQGPALWLDWLANPLWRLEASTDCGAGSWGQEACTIQLAFPGACRALIDASSPCRFWRLRKL